MWFTNPEYKEHIKTLPDMKYDLGDVVKFKFSDSIRTGFICVADFGGSLEHDFHSYDIENSEENMLYKHIPEKAIIELIKKYDNNSTLDGEEYG